MRALRIAEKTVHLAEAPAPTPGPDELLVRVLASALNRADLLQCQGHYPAPPGSPQDIPGLEYCGEVMAVGARVTRFKPGARVMGLVGGGAWAEQLTVHEREAVAVPAALSAEQAAAIPEAFFTAYDALVLQAGLTAGQRVLIHAAASGVGTAAAQLCRLAGATAVGTTRSARKVAAIAGLGFARVLVVDAAPPSFATAAVEALGGAGADVCLDLVGGRWLPETIDAMALGGVVMLVGLTAGGTAELPLRTVLGRRLRLIGTTLRARPLEQKIALAQRVERDLLPHFARGALAPVIDAALPMSQAPAALQRLSSNDTVGKLVLTW